MAKRLPTLLRRASVVRLSEQPARFRERAIFGIGARHLTCGMISRPSINGLRGAGVIARALIPSLLFGAATTMELAPLSAAPLSPRPVQIRSAPLADALAQLIRQTGAEVLYDRRIVQGLRSPEVRGTMLPERALARLLAGSGVGYKRTAEGVFILFTRSRSAPEPAEQAVVPEILVIGRRNQNADIRRTRNDIQPYVVSTRDDIENAHRDNVGHFFRSRISANAQIVDPSQDTFSLPGSVNSEINLRGLGSLRTLVLVDGRRMPSLPTPQFDFGQADLNAIPISSIDRIETLTGTAGGIYGPGAIGGVVNIVLRRDYRGADLHLVSGISSRGDASRLGIEGRIGFTPDDGRTDVMIFASRTTVEPLRTDDVDYEVRAIRHRFANDPADFLRDAIAANAVTVQSQSGNLTFDPEFGGGTLPSDITFLPIGFSGTAAERTALLTANAGIVRLDLPDDDGGTKRYVLSNPTVTSGIVNIRHRFSPKLEAFADLLYFRNDGKFVGSGSQVAVITDANAPNNPFQQPVIFLYPNPNLRGRAETKLDTRRLTTGLVADLGSGWKGSAEATVGKVSTVLHVSDVAPGLAFRFAQGAGTLGSDGLPIVDPLGNWDKLVAAAASYAGTTSVDLDQVNRFSIGSLRAAGKVMTLPAGPLSLTLLAERRREHSPERNAAFSFNSVDFEFPLPVRKQTVTSGYAELRAPLLTKDGVPAVLRDLEIQLAARLDRVKAIVPGNAVPVTPSNDQLESIINSGATFTAGARAFPSSSLMLRGSIATGDLPPTIEQLAVNERIYGNGQLGAGDPRRGNRALGSEGIVVFLSHGSHALKSERATTISLGAVVNPTGGSRPRISIDYSRIDLRREVSFLASTLGEILAQEDTFAGTIVREPLTDADRAIGFTAGRIVSVDARALNGGRSLIETVDAQLDWTIPAGSLGQVRFYGNATWYPTYKNKKLRGAPWIDRVGYSDGPLDFRGNVGVEWTRNSLMIGLNAQYYDDYRPTYSDAAFAPVNDLILKYQGSNRIQSQAYLDLTIRRRFTFPGRPLLKTFDLNFGIQNLFDRRPSLVAESRLTGYSFYGDPRRRRFELILSGGF